MLKSKKKIDKLIQRVIAIDEKDAADDGRVAYMARAMVMATLPHSKQQGFVFQRINGHYRLTIKADPEYGLPYGSVPRILLAWITTEATRLKSPVIELGANLKEFLGKLGLTSCGGARGDITRLKQQMLRLFTSSISFIYNDKESGYIGCDQFHLVKSFQLWWNPLQLKDRLVPNTTITLTSDFYDEIVKHPVPIDAAVLQELKRSPLQLDLYIWLTYRFSYLKKPTQIPWELLKNQFGCDYAQTKQGLRDFKRKFKDALKTVLFVYKDAKVDELEGGIRLKPSATHVRKKR